MRSSGNEERQAQGAADEERVEEFLRLLLFAGFRSVKVKEPPRVESSGWRQKSASLFEHTVQQMLLFVRAFGLCEQQPLFVFGEV